MAQQVATNVGGHNMEQEIQALTSLEIGQDEHERIGAKHGQVFVQFDGNDAKDTEKVLPNLQQVGVGNGPGTGEESTGSAASETDAADREMQVKVYCCQRCRCVLFTEDQLSVQHEEGLHLIGYRKLEKEESSGATNVSQTSKMEGVACTSLFVQEPNRWMEVITSSENQGKLGCPKCGHRVGSFTWSGAQCSCGTWIVPAIQIPISKIDPRVMQRTDLPEHVLGVEIPAKDEEAVVIEEEEQQQQPRALTSEQLRVQAHKLWIQYTNEANVDGLLSMIDQEECSLTTIQRKIFDGYHLVSKALSTSSIRLKDRITVHDHGPIALPSPSTTSRAIFDVEGVAVPIGESIVWAVDPTKNLCKVQHIFRTKDPSPESFLSI